MKYTPSVSPAMTLSQRLLLKRYELEWRQADAKMEKNGELTKGIFKNSLAWLQLNVRSVHITCTHDCDHPFPKSILQISLPRDGGGGGGGNPTSFPGLFPVKISRLLKFKNGKSPGNEVGSSKEASFRIYIFLRCDFWQHCKTLWCLHLAATSLS